MPPPRIICGPRQHALVDHTVIIMLSERGNAAEGGESGCVFRDAPGFADWLSFHPSEVLCACHRLNRKSWSPDATRHSKDLGPLR